MTPLRELAGILLLGVIQGLTEFLPVSSSGHLVVGQRVLGLAPPSLLLDVVLHVGTLVPVLWVYRDEIGRMIASVPRLPRAKTLWPDDAPLRLTVWVMVGSVPTALIGLLFKDSFERLFASVTAVGVAFLVTGAILMLSRLAAKRRLDADSDKPHTLTLVRALAIGVAQGLAITPGISRSGTTISTALLLGVERELAARFSFILSVPAILGATALQLRDVAIDAQAAYLFTAGALAAAISGYIALRIVIRTVRHGSFHWFSLYLWPLGIAVLIYVF